MSWRSLAGVVVKVALSGAALAAFVAIIQYAQAVLFPAASRSPVSMPSPVTSGRPVGNDARRLWPVFPGARPSGLHEMTFSGARLVSETWDLTGSTEALLEYMLDQMTARGWAVVPEESVDWRTTALEQNPGADAERREIAALVDDTMIPMLSLARGAWRFSISVGPGDRPWNRRAKLLCVETASIRDLGHDLAEMAESARAREEENVVHAEERIGSEIFHSQMIKSPVEAGAFLESKVRELEQDDWRASVVTTPEPGVQRQLFALLQRGDETTYLIVSPGERGRGSSAVLTKVTKAN